MAMLPGLFDPTGQDVDPRFAQNRAQAAQYANMTPQQRSSFGTMNAALDGADAIGGAVRQVAGMPNERERMQMARNEMSARSQGVTDQVQLLQIAIETLQKYGFPQQAAQAAAQLEQTKNAQRDDARAQEKIRLDDKAKQTKNEILAGGGEKGALMNRLMQMRKDLALYDPGTPEYNNLKAGIAKLEQVLAKDNIIARNQGGFTQIYVNGEPTTAVENTTSPDAELRASTAEHVAALKRIAGFVQPTLSDETLRAAAAKYNIDGTLPPLGMGQQAAANKAAILEEATRQSTGVDPGDRARAQITNKATIQALSPMFRQAGFIEQYERQFQDNVKLLQQQIPALNNGTIPIINKWVNAGKSNIAGDPAVTNFNAAVKAVQNEFAKIVSGSTGNQQIAVSEIQRMEKLLNDAQTPDQIMGVLNMYVQETQNRIRNVKGVLSEMKNSLTPATPRAGAAPAGGLPAGMPSADAIEAELARRAGNR